MDLLCWMDGSRLVIRNDSRTALDLGHGARIAIDVTGEAHPARCEGFTSGVGDGKVVLTSTRRRRWWFLRALLVVELPEGARAISVEFENAAYDVAPRRTGERSTGSVIINSFTADPLLFENITAPATVYLSWSTTNASKVTLSSVGIVNPTQTRLPMAIQATTTFVLTAYDSALDQMDSRSVTVSVEPPLVSRLVPPGTIALWSGSEADVPDGWHVCNGSNGTPDLRDRFVMGAGSSEDAGRSGEEQTHRHEVPSWTVSPETTEQADHRHKFPESWYGRDFEGGDFSGIDTNGEFNQDTAETEPAGKHKHQVQITFPKFNSELNTGSVRPRWYALFYIMKGL